MFLHQGATALHISLLHPHGEGASSPAVLVRGATSDAQQQLLYGSLYDAVYDTHELQAQHRVCHGTLEPSLA